MIHCAICDDDPGFVDLAKEIAQITFRERDWAVSIHTYTSSKWFLYDIYEGARFDIAIIDIEMPGVTGLQLAAEIKVKNPSCLIVFLTAYVKYAVESYELQIFRYIPKQDIHEKLPKYICDAVKMTLIQENKVFLYRHSSCVSKIPYAEIEYIRKDGKYSVIYTTNNSTVRIRVPIAEIRKNLDTEEFLTTDRGYIVNIVSIQKIEGNTLQLKDGVVLPISRSHMKEIKEQVFSYWGGKL